MGVERFGGSKKEYQAFLHSLSYAPLYELIRDYPDVYNARIYVVKKGQPWPDRILKKGDYLYVLLSNGELRIPLLPHTELDMHHPQLAKRLPVIRAGVFGWSGKEVLYIDNKSGCYAPDSDSLYYVVEAFKFYGVPLSKNLKIDYFLHY